MNTNEDDFLPDRIDEFLDNNPNVQIQLNVIPEETTMITGDQTLELLGGTINSKGEISWSNGITGRPHFMPDDLEYECYFPDRWQFYWSDGRPLQAGESFMLPSGATLIQKVLL
jgi:hypothetical protein